MPVSPKRKQQNRTNVARFRAKVKAEDLDCIMEGIIITVKHDYDEGRGVVTYDMDATGHAAFATAAANAGQTLEQFLDAHIKRTLATVKELRARAGK